MSPLILMDMVFFCTGYLFAKALMGISINDLCEENNFLREELKYTRVELAVVSMQINEVHHESNNH